MNKNWVEKISELISIKNNLDTFEKKVCWLEELGYFLKKNKTKDPMVLEIIEFLEDTNFRDSSY